MAIFDEPLVRRRRPGAVFIAIVILVLILLFVVMPSIGPYTQYLWYKEDARHPQVFWLLYQTKSILFAGFFVVSLAIIYINVARALKISTVYSDRPTTVSEVLVSRLLEVMKQHGQLIGKIASVVIAFLLSAEFSDEWMTFLRSTHAHAFGHVDPIFGKDLSFFVFSLPWQLAIVRSLLGLFILTTVITTGIYVALQGIAILGRIDIGRNVVRGHVALLVGICVITFAVQMWLERYQVGLQDNVQFVGGGYTAIHQLALQGPLAILLMVVGLLFCLAPLWQPGWSVAIGAGAAYLVLAVIGLGLYPFILSAWYVPQNRNTLEAPYASKAIEMTRYAYALDAIEVKNTDVHDQPSATDLASAKGTLDNMRLWDPDTLRQAVESLQGLKTYYRFNDVDIDRYTINGKRQMVMLAPRDIYVEGLSDSAQTWVNQHLEYTHGFGLTMSPVNTANESGQPDFIIKDLPPTTPTDLPITEPRIYFSDFKGSAGDNYVLVDTKVDEFDYPSQTNNQTNRWSGDRGISVAPFFSKLALAIELGDKNIFISSNITGNSRLLMHRGVVDRASLIYPFLSFDQDPYMVVNNGHLMWILDGYISTDQMPYSAYSDMISIPGRPNYIRNPVKVVIDAYTGETNAYAIQPDEPLLQTYESIYPGLIQDISALPTGLREHFRYPQDLFTAQAEQVKQYHVTDPLAFLNNEDAWDMPTEKGASGQEEQMQPYYVQMRLPADPKDEFLLILPFTPRNKGNMSGWLAAHCDPDRYGKLWLYDYKQGVLLSGPKQMEANFNQSPAIANLYTLLKNEQSQISVGKSACRPDWQQCDVCRTYVSWKCGHGNYCYSGTA